MADQLLDVLERRVAALEQELGQEAELPLTDSLNNAFKHVQQLVQEHENIKRIWDECGSQLVSRCSSFSACAFCVLCLFVCLCVPVLMS